MPAENSVRTENAEVPSIHEILGSIETVDAAGSQQMESDVAGFRPTCSWREAFDNDSLLLDEPAEEAVLFPLRAVIGVGDTQRQTFEDSIELRGGREVDRLAQVI